MDFVQGNVSVEIWEGKAKIRIRVGDDDTSHVSMRKLASIAVDAIITCPKCAKNHKVNPDSLKPFADAGKKTIMDSCKSCKFKFKQLILTLFKVRANL